MATDDAGVRELVAHWRRAAPALAARHAEELRALTESEAAAAADELLELVALLPPKKEATGLVEQQRLLAALRP